MKYNRKLKKRSNIYYTINYQFKIVSQRIKFLKWVKNGRPVPVPHLVKQKTLLEYARKYNLRVLVETGTYYGDMVQAMKNHFDRIFSIELSEVLADVASWRFKDQTHIEIIQGDSGVALGSLIGRLDTPTLFWLDGHYSAGVTAKGKKDTPIFEELAHIHNREGQKDVIIIDDARCFGTDADYPTLKELEEFVKNKWSDCLFQVKDDSIRIVCQ